MIVALDTTLVVVVLFTARLVVVESVAAGILVGFVVFVEVLFKTHLDPPY